MDFSSNPYNILRVKKNILFKKLRSNISGYSLSNEYTYAVVELKQNWNRFEQGKNNTGKESKCDYTILQEVPLA